MEDKEVGKAKKPRRIIRCSVPLCTNTNRTRKGINFYCFPNEFSNQIRCSEWCSAVGIPFSKLRQQRVCMDHFPEEAFKPNYSDLLPEFPYKQQRRLIKGVVPSLLLPDQNAIAAAIAKDAESKLLKKAENAQPKLEASVVEACTDSTELEPSSPPPPKKRRTRQSTMLADLFLKPKVHESCLMCSKKNVSNDISLYTFAGSNGFPLLNRQLWQTFVFRKLLKLPAWKYEEILTKTGSITDPGEWLIICSVCKETVNNILKMQQEMRVLTVKVNRLKQLVERKFTESVEEGNSKNHNSDSGSGSVFNIHYEIRMFMKNSRQGFPDVDEKDRSSEISDLDAVDNIGLKPISQNLETVDSECDSDNSRIWDDNNEEGCEEKRDNVGGMDLSDDERLRDPSASHSDENTTAQDDLDVLEVEDVAIPDQNDFQRKAETFWNSKPLVRRGHNISGKFQCKICLRRYSSRGKLSQHMVCHAESRKLYNGAFDCFKCRAPYLTRKSLEYHFRSEHCMRLHESWDISLPQEKYAFTKKTKKEVLAKLINEGKRVIRNTVAEKKLKSSSAAAPSETFEKRTEDRDVSKAMHEGCPKIVENFENKEKESVHNGKRYSTEDGHEKEKSGNTSDEEWLPDADVSSDEEIETAVAQNDSMESTVGLDDEDCDQIEKTNISKPLKRRGLNKSGRFQCKICLRFYNKRSTYKAHIKFHVQTKRVHNGAYDCFKCKTPFGTKKSLQNHFRTEHCMRLHESWEVSLPQEEYAYNQKTKNEVLVRLARESKLKGLHECEHCPLKFFSKKRLENHIEYHKQSKEVYGGRMDCSQCKVPFKILRSLKDHLKRYHQLVLDSTWDGNTPQEDNIKPVDSADRSVEPDRNGMYKCPRCDAEFKVKTKYDDHMRQHQNAPENLHCPECHRPYLTEETLKQHLRRVHKISDSNNICELCGFNARSQRILQQHMTKHKIYDGSVDPSISTTHFVCTVCKELFKTRRQLSIHRVNAHFEELGIEVFKCTEGDCKKVFLRQSGLIAHIAEKHKNGCKFQCEECGYKAFTQYRLRMHRVKHEKTVRMCEYCSAVYHHFTGFSSHMKKYHPEKFQPSRHNYFDGVQVDKLDHEYGHDELPMGSTGVQEPRKEYPCKYCHGVFPHKLGLKYHINSVHKDLFAYNCDLCERVYMSVQSLKLHKKINHAGNTRVSCGWCSKVVSHKMQLYDHQKACPKKPKGPDVPKILVADVAVAEDNSAESSI